MANQVLYKLSLGFVLGLITVLPAFAQPALTRSTFTSNYDPIAPSTGATTSTASGDNAIQSGIPIGFTFNYLGTNYTTIGISTNGIVSFSGITASANNIDLYTSSSPANVLAPWWDDLATGSGEILYQTLGSPGSRQFIVQWTNVLSYNSGSAAELNFQVELHETSNVIEFRYGPVYGNGFNTSQESACIGIKSASGGNGQYIDAVTGSSFTGNAMLAAWRTWPSRNFRFSPGLPTPLSGTFNVGAGDVYATLSDAIADVNHRGVSGPVTLRLHDTTFDEAHGNFFPILIGPVSGTSMLNPFEIHSYLPLNGRAFVTGKGALAGSCVTQGSLTAITPANEPILALVGTQHAGIFHTNFIAADAEVDRGISVINASATQGTQYCGLSDLFIRLFNSNTATIGLEQRLATTPANGAGANSRNVYNGFNIGSTHTGISITGDAQIPDSSITICGLSPYEFNVIGDTVAGDIGGGTQDVYGIVVRNQFNISISKTMVRNAASSGSGKLAGISATGCRGNCSVFENKILSLVNTDASSTAPVLGIEVSNSPGVASLSVYNNFVCRLSSSYNGLPTAQRQIRGIYIASPAGDNSSEINVDFNTVLIDSPGDKCSNSCFETSTIAGPVVHLRNNIFANETPAQVSPAAHYGVVTPGITTVGNAGSLSDYNNIFVRHAGGGAAVMGSATNYASLSDWQTASASDMHSLSIDALFNGSPDLHVNEPLLNAAGIAVVGIDNDIDYQGRGSSPDIGADEFGIVVDPGVQAFSPGDGSCAAAGTPVMVQIKNYSPAAIDFNVDPLFIYADVSGAASAHLTASVTNNALNGNIPLPAGGMISVPVGTLNTAYASAYHFTIYIYAQNDTNALNDTLRQTIYTDTLPVAAFTYTQSGATIDFNNNSTSASSYQWNFGDNQVSTADNPSHTYTQSGNYLVMLVAADQCGADTMQTQLPFISTDIAETQLSSVHVFPNPTSDKVTVYIANPANDLVIGLYDVHGALVQEKNVGSVQAGTDIAMDLSGCVPGDYVLWLRSAGSACYTKVTVQK